MSSFLPILLGTDMNVYGMARAFHEEYGITSLAIGNFALLPTKHSSIVNVKIFKNFDKHEFFLNGLDVICRKYKNYNDKLLLIACGDVYAKLIINNLDYLKENFIVPYIDKGLMNKLINKEAFYNMCKEYNLNYPETYVVTKKNKDNINLPFGFPVVLKPSNSVAYLNCSFDGKKKAFIVETRREFDNIINKIYNSSYEDSMIAQDFVPGDDSNMRVLNCYVGKDRKVKLMCLGHPLLEDHAPNTIGNYVAIMNEYNREIYDKMQTFLEAINYTGFANFDMKYDNRDGKYKLFEINLRQGRSSYYVTGSGYNLAKYVTDDVIFNKDIKLTLADKEYLWLGVPKKLVIKYVNFEYKNKIKDLIKQNEVCNTLFYKKDFNIKRYVKNTYFFMNYYRTFKKYFNSY